MNSRMLVAAFLLILWVTAIVRLVGAIFSRRIQDAIVKRPFFHLVWIGAAIVTAFFTPMIHLPPAPNERHRALTDLKNLESACRSYANEYGTYPSSNPVQFLQILRGGNTRGIVFVETPSRRSAISRQGEFVDPWGTPYRFSITTNQPPVFLSAGPNHLFGDQDDLSTTN